MTPAALQYPVDVVIYRDICFERSARGLVFEERADTVRAF